MTICAKMEVFAPNHDALEVSPPQNRINFTLDSLESRQNEISEHHNMVEVNTLNSLIILYYFKYKYDNENTSS